MAKAMYDGARVDILIQISRGQSPIAKNAAPVVFQHRLTKQTDVLTVPLPERAVVPLPGLAASALGLAAL
jgi:hypothetical protein